MRITELFYIFISYNLIQPCLFEYLPLVAMATAGILRVKITLLSLLKPDNFVTVLLKMKGEAN